MRKTIASGLYHRNCLIIVCVLLNALSVLIALLMETQHAGRQGCMEASLSGGYSRLRRRLFDDAIVLLQSVVTGLQHSKVLITRAFPLRLEAAEAGA